MHGASFGKQLLVHHSHVMSMTWYTQSVAREIAADTLTFRSVLLQPSRERLSTDLPTC